MLLEGNSTFFSLSCTSPLPLLHFFNLHIPKFRLCFLTFFLVLFRHSPHLHPSPHPQCSHASRYSWCLSALCPSPLPPSLYPPPRSYLLILVVSAPVSISCPGSLRRACLPARFDRQAPDLVSDAAATLAEGSVSLTFSDITRKRSSGGHAHVRAQTHVHD